MSAEKPEEKSLADVLVGAIIGVIGSIAFFTLAGMLAGFFTIGYRWVVSP